MGVNRVTPAEPLAFSFSVERKKESRERFFLALQFLSLLKPAQRTGLSACTKHAAVPQPRALLPLRLRKWSFVEWRITTDLRAWKLPNSLSKVPWSSPCGGVCCQLGVKKEALLCCQSEECCGLLPALGYLVFHLRTMQVHLNNHCLLVSLLSKQVKTSGSVLSSGFILIVSGYNGTLSI